MNTKKYLQTDSAWSGLGCPAYPCYIGRDGCGLVSIANILIEMEQYAQYTPATIQPYCKKFMASDCEGTIWSGVPVMLKHYGLTDVMEHQNFSTLWPELAKGNRVVFYIMGSAPGGSKRVKWTSGGHCVCSVDYKYEDGLHKVYMKDSYSDSPLRNKWISYEENIRGACLAIWSGKLVGTPTPPPTPPKPGELVVDGICGAETVMAMEQFFKVEIDGEISGQLTKWKNYYPSITAISFGAGGSRVIYKLQEWLNLSDPDGILGPNTTKAWQKRLRDYGYFANPQETIDGIIGAKTMKAWQECLNNGCKPKGSPTPPTPTPTGKLDVDGVGGYETVKRLQEFLGLSNPDGLIGRQRKSMIAKSVPTLTAVAYSSSGGSNTVTALQKWLGLSNPDGLWGTNTSTALQNRLRSLGYTTAPTSGSITISWMKLLQTALNNDFKKVTPTPPTPPTPTPTTYTNVIDVSYVQKSIDWAKVKASGIVGAMVRCGYRGYETAKLNEDKMFLNHIKGASAAGLKVGVYFFTEAINYAEGREEAEFALKLIEKAGVNLYYPIAVDTEYIGEDDEGIIPRADNISKSARTDAIKGFCDVIKERGGQPMIYASLSWFDTHLDMNKLPFDVWVAQYYTECQYKGKYLMWQYTSKGSVEGVKGVVDMNKCYITSASPMPTPTPQPTPQPAPSGGHYTGAYPSVHVTRDAAHVVGNAVNFGKWVAGMNDFHYGHGDHAHHNGCYFCGTNGAKKGYMKMWEHTYCCNPFVHACYAHGGLVPSMLKMCQQGRSYGFKRGEGYDTSNLFKKISRSEAKAGDVFCSDCHVALYIGNGKIVHAGSEDDNVPYSDSWNRSITIGEWKDKYYDPPRVYRFVGSVDADIIIRKGEVSGRVKDLQAYLNWYTNGEFCEKCGQPDGYYGENTYKYVVKMQTDFFGAKEADGTVGNKTIAKMREVVR